MLVASVLVVAVLGLALWAFRGAYTFLPSLNLRRSLVADTPPVIGPAPPRLARRVVVVLVDGLRLDTSYGRPFLDALRARGIDAAARSHFPSISMPNYVSIVAGVEPRWSGVRTNDFRGRVEVDNMMVRARAAGMRVAYVSYSGDGLPIMFGDDLDEGGITPWPGGTERAVTNVLRRGDELLLYWVLDVDDAGHEFGGATPEYRTAARRVDLRLGALFSELDLTRDTIVVTADHGHVDTGGHGGIEDEVMEVPLILAGAGIKPGATLVGARLIDVSPTVCALLGLPPPGHSLGRVLTEALEIDPATRQAIEEGDAARHARILPVVLAIDEATQRELWHVHGRRGAIAAALLVAMLLFTRAAARRGWVEIDRRVLLIAVPAFPLTFYSLVVVFENWLSPSMVPPQGSVTSKLFRYGAVAAAINLSAVWVALAGRVVPAARLAAAVGVALVGTIVALVPAGAAWALAGPTMAESLPGPRLLMLPPVTYGAVTSYAVSAVIPLMIEFVVFMARSSDPRRLKAGRSVPTI